MEMLNDNEIAYWSDRLSELVKLRMQALNDDKEETGKQGKRLADIYADDIRQTCRVLYWIQSEDWKS